MKKIAVLAAAIMLAACAGLASAQAPTITKVMVNEKGKTPLIWINQEPIIVHGESAVTITWEINATGYQFPDNGIEFAGGGKDQFVKCIPIKDRQRFQCTDRNTVSGPFKYTIRVVRTGASGLLVELDPTVMND